MEMDGTAVAVTRHFERISQNIFSPGASNRGVLKVTMKYRSAKSVKRDFLLESRGQKQSKEEISL